MERLVDERDTNGAFTSIDDLATRVDPRLVNKRQLETLAAARCVRQPRSEPRGRPRGRRNDPGGRGADA